MIASRLLVTRFTDAVGGIVAGSTARGEDTATSDLDLVVLRHMTAFGTVVADTDGRGARLQELARARWDAGPEALDPRERDDRRYRLTALLDDLTDEPDPGERTAVAVAVFTEVADLALARRRAWTGTGRWLVRRLRETDAELCRGLLLGLEQAVGATGDPGALLRVARHELDRLGGPLDDGYERRARRGG